MNKLRLLFLFLVLSSCIAAQQRPQLLVSDSEREALLRKIETASWAKTGYAKLRNEVDRYVALTEQNPDFMTSRLAMNWETKCTTPLVEKETLTGCEGKAPLPTPRFAGSRNWVTAFATPSLEALKPYNDNSGLMWLPDKKDMVYRWVKPAETGRIIETINERIMSVASKAAFVYFLTKDEKYARFATDILVAYLQGLDHVTAPKIVDNNEVTKRIIGVTSMEVIHEGVVIPMAVIFDFTHDYLKKSKRDLGLLQRQFKRFADRIIEGGQRDGNWNLHQSILIAYAGLTLDDDTAFDDQKGRQYYINQVLNADLPNQQGVLRTIECCVDADSALWPEAPGYGFDAIYNLIEIGSLLSKAKGGEPILNNPLLVRAATAPLEMIYPNGWSTGLGDTYHTRFTAAAAELMIAKARASGDRETERKLTVILQREILTKNYKREGLDSLVALTKYVDKLADYPLELEENRAFFAEPLNFWMMRSTDNRLAAAIYGSKGGHVHSNGLAMELYGAGVILGTDPGRGESYWQAEHREYYLQPPAHNTVVPNGNATYGDRADQTIAMSVQLAEPASARKGVSPNVNFVQSSFEYKAPAAKQKRTLALVRTGAESGFYFDIFRSINLNAGNRNFHDYVYHNLGSTLELKDFSGNPLLTKDSDDLSSRHGNLKAYDYWKNEKSIESPAGFHGVFTLPLTDRPAAKMGVWSVVGDGRKLYQFNAPQSRVLRPSLPKELSELPVPSFLIRHTGDAWERPFAVAFEPFNSSAGDTIRAIRPAKVEGEQRGLAAFVVDGLTKEKILPEFSVLILEDESAALRKVENATFQGNFGVIVNRGAYLYDLYLGHGLGLIYKNIAIISNTGKPISASIQQTPTGWQYSATGDVKTNLIFSLPAGAAADDGFTIVANGRKLTEFKVSVVTTGGGQKVLTANGVLPAGMSQNLTVEKAKN